MEGILEPLKIYIREYIDIGALRPGATATPAGGRRLARYDRYGESDPPPGPFSAVGAGHLFSCGLRPDGAIACWGANDLGQSTPPVETPPDTTPPTVRCTVRPSALWPPNHKLVAVAVDVSVEDEGSGPAGFELQSATSDQPDRDGPHAGDVEGWAPGTADAAGLLRAERDGGRARRYTLAYRGFDRAGNAAGCTATVTVPASR